MSGESSSWCWTSRGTCGNSKAAEGEGEESMDLRWPASRAEIAAIQRERKRIAFERARKAPFYQGRLDGIDPERLDDPSVWAKIPLLTKEDLRRIAPKDFHAQF